MHKQTSRFAPQLLRIALLSVVPLLATSVTSSCRAQQQTTSVIRDNDRIVFVGDSNTGRGYNGGQGFIHLIREALQETHPGGKITVVGLGGSGQGTGSWVGVERESRTKSTKLDVPSFDVKEELDKPADVVVIMLGTNDVLSPYISADTEGFDRWTNDYKTLITALRERVKPRVVAIATIPPCTEGADSPKNLAITEMNTRLAEIAKTDNAVLLPTNQALWSVLKTGRTLRPDFHILEDFVHPNNIGHFAIAKGMLQGFGEPVAEKLIDTKYLAPAWKTVAPELPALSYVVEPLPAELNAEKQDYKLHYWFTTGLPGEAVAKPPTNVSLTLPEGWTTTKKTPPGTFLISGQPDRLHNKLTLEVKEGAIAKKVTVDIPPPWIIGSAHAPRDGWATDYSSFDPVAGRFPADDALIKGQGWGQTAELTSGTPFTWKRWTPSVDYVGGCKPGNIDMSAISFFGTFDVAYAMRWVYSDRPRTVQYKLSGEAFSGNGPLSVWVNGENIFSGMLSSNNGKIVDAKLAKGWNPMVVKANHLRWQWQFSVDLVETPTDDLRDLRFSLVPHNN